jgi:hypothetical protein
MTGSEPAYEPKLYWERRLSQHFDLKGVGNIGFSTTYNGWLYSAASKDSSRRKT